jgi:hypothetical protein
LVWVPLAACGAAVMAYMQANHWPYSGPILYGLGIFALLLICGTCISWAASISKRVSSTIAPTQAKRVIRDWLDAGGLNVQSVATINDQLFFYSVTLNGRKIAVHQRKSNLRYLYFASIIGFTAEDNRAMSTLPGGSDSVIRDLRIGLANFRVGYAGIDLPLQKLTITKEIFITDDFNEYEFIQALYLMESAIVLVHEVVRPKPSAAMEYPPTPPSVASELPKQSS